MKAAVSLLELPDSEDTVLLLLLDAELLDSPDLEDRSDLDPVDLDLDRRCDLSVGLDVGSEADEMPETSERSDDSSETDDSFVLELSSDTEDRTVVDWVFRSGTGSGSGSGWMAITLVEGDTG